MQTLSINLLSLKDQKEVKSEDSEMTFVTLFKLKVETELRAINRTIGFRKKTINQQSDMLCKI